ncbi:mycofactocin system FadH/OYE family oxidoreductase 1 [Micromonospora sp. CPCC 205711]|uniref:mycofactocin system FadH/OYE family oxidoreductase 1 n=1 Tax=Micromonospora sp. CPCC 205547 TaxID=3122400 RepID=UPI002FEF33E9
MTTGGIGPTDPVELAGRRAPSRVLFGPHETNLGRGRALSPAHVGYYARRAAGGAGVVVVETASVHDSDWPYERAPLAADCGPGWAAVVAACRPHGTLVLAGLGHAGGQGSSAWSQGALWAPSGVPDVITREMPMAMEQPEIDALTAGFASAAGLAVRAGADGVEIDAGQHSILRQFLSALTNVRTDRYGADRSRLVREVLSAVRTAIGGDAVLGLRLSCDELAPWAGITPQAAAELAVEFAPAVDYLAVVRGSAYGVPATRPDLHTEPGFNRDLCGSVRKAVADATPVVFQGSVVDPARAQEALRDGTADLVEMTRAQIADPDLVAKWRAGRPERIRPCVLCNQRCRVRDSRNPVVSCLAEPASGYESEDVPATEGRDRTSRDVLVVGGGPGGLEAARVLATRGHRVELAERAGRLGGALRHAAAVGGRSRLGELVDWWERELGRLGVTVRTGVTVTATDLDAAVASGRAVLLATGGVPGPRDFPAAVDVADLLVATPDGGTVGAALPPGPVVVSDEVGDAVGVGVAELLAAAGRPTALVTRDPVPGVQLALTGDLADANGRLQRAGVRLLRRSRVRAVESGRVVVEDVYTAERTSLDCAVLVHWGHRLPQPELADVHPDAPRAGDCVAPRTVHEAVREGRRAALALVGAG